MNTADYLSTTDYPVTTQGLDFIQNQILCLEQMAAAFGDGNWILSGMTEDAEGNLTPGVVALVENSKATVVNFTQGGVSASDLKSKRFRVDSVTNALPKRTYQFLVPDEDGEITNLDRIDIHELSEQIKDNAAAIAKNASNISAIAERRFNIYKLTGNEFTDLLSNATILSCHIVIQHVSKVGVYTSLNISFPRNSAPQGILEGFYLDDGNPTRFTFDFPSIPDANQDIVSIAVVYLRQTTNY